MYRNRKCYRDKAFIRTAPDCNLTIFEPLKSSHYQQENVLMAVGLDSVLVITRFYNFLPYQLYHGEANIQFPSNI